MNKENSCGMLFKRIHEGFEKRLNNDLKAADLTMSQAATLFILLSQSEKEMSLKELEHTLNVAQSTSAGIVCRLEQKGFVTSYGQQDDKRIKNVRITESGEKYSKRAEKILECIEEECLKNLTKEEQKQLQILLIKVCEAL